MPAEEIARLTRSIQEDQATSTAEIKALQEALQHAEQKQQLLQTQLDSSCHTIQTLQLQNERLQQNSASATSAAATAAEAQQALQAHCSNLQQQVKQRQHSDADGFQQQSAAVLQLLEGQLVSLSGQVKEKDQQLAALQQTVQQQCDERMLMQGRLVQLSRAANSSNASTSSVSVINEQQTLTLPSGAASGRNVFDADVNKGSVAAKDDTQPAEAVTTKRGQGKLNRMASASEQSVGKTGLLARILATDSTTGKACR